MIRLLEALRDNILIALKFSLKIWIKNYLKKKGGGEEKLWYHDTQSSGYLFFFRAQKLPWEEREKKKKKRDKVQKSAWSHNMG